MVSQASVQAKTNKGYGKAATALGVNAAWYRPTGPSSPITEASQLGWLQVLLDTTPALSQTQPRRRERPESWYAGFDRTSGARVGDYLVMPDGETFFITTMDPFRASRLVVCNTEVTITEARAVAQVGFNSDYGGDVRDDEVVVASGYPALLLKGPRGDTGPVQLPGDTKMPWWEIMLPAIPGVALRNNMIVTYADPSGEAFRLILMLAELSALGYRCFAIMQTT